MHMENPYVLGIYVFLNKIFVLSHMYAETPKGPEYS